jgi:hypothetical protein
MSTAPLHDAAYRRDLGDGLVLRWSTAADVEQITQLYAFVFRNKAEDPLNEHLPAWTRDMMSGRHPLVGPGDFAVVEDTRQATIVAATSLMRATWEYAGVRCAVGRPEIVASHPDYRNRGLVRAIFELLHARSAALGHLLQGITGIPYYYRQFGYEYAIDLDGSRGVYFDSIPKLKEGEAEPYHLRDATAEDLPRVAALYDRERAGLLVSAPFDERYWRWVQDGQNPASAESWLIKLIVDGAGQPVGYVLPRRKRWGEVLGVAGVMVEPGVPLTAVVPSLLRALRALALELPGFKASDPPAHRLGFALRTGHPLYAAMGPLLAPRNIPPYAWYVRVPDLPAFIRHIAPVLEQRLADSALSGYNGELKLDFYRGGLRMVFEQGRLTTAESWRKPVWGQANAGFPPLVFQQLLLGHRTLDELRYIFPDVWAEDAHQALEVLFPKQTSWALPMD